MKKIIAMILGFVCVLSLVGCGATKIVSKTNNPVDIEKLKTNYPEYFEMTTFKGIEVYVWQMAENSYRCGMMIGTNRLKTDEEITALQFKSLSIEEAKAILDEIGVEKDGRHIIPISQSYSSFAYEVDDDYRKKVTKLFD